MRKSGIARWGVMILSLAAALVLPAFQGVLAQEAQGLQITALNLTAQEESRAVPEGQQTAPARPGDIIEYRLLFTNTTEGAIANVVFNDPIPQGLVYVIGSAGADRAGVEAAFSIDGGATYSAEPTVDVVEAGVTNRRPAPAESYTHVRWTVTGALDPQETVQAAFRVRIPSGLATG